MLTTLVVRSLYEGDPTGGTAFTTLTIPILGYSESSDLVVRDITGLEPAPATINTKNYGSLDGDFFSSKRVQRRNIVFKLGINSSGGPQSVDDIRRMCYAYGLVTSGFVALRFIFDDDRPDLEILGYVETVSPNRFAKDPEMQVSVICPKPNFVSVTETTITGEINAVAEAFLMNGNAVTPIKLSFDAAVDPIGANEDLVIEFGPTAGVNKNFTLVNTSIPGGTFELSSIRGEKYVRFFGSISLLKYMTPASLWPYLVPGGNTFRVRAPDDLANDTEWTMKFRDEYSGL